MIRTGGLSHVELAVCDVERAVRFYGDVFGFEVVARHGDGVLLQVPGGLGSIAVEPAQDSRTAGATRFGLVLSNRGELDAAVRLAIAHGGSLVERTDHPVGGATAVIADPAGHRITL
jgi:catechol 2,3-dioxygenase-like lactoylglutathione lyase family enzyme